MVLNFDGFQSWLLTWLTSRVHNFVSIVTLLTRVIRVDCIMVNFTVFLRFFYFFAWKNLDELFAQLFDGIQPWLLTCLTLKDPNLVNIGRILTKLAPFDRSQPIKNSGPINKKLLISQNSGPGSNFWGKRCHY